MHIAIVLTIACIAMGPSFARAQPPEDLHTDEVERSVRAADAALLARDRRWARDELRAAEAFAPDDGRVALARAALHHRREPSLALTFEPDEAARLAAEHDGWELERGLGFAMGALGAVAGLGSAILLVYGVLDNGCTDGLSPAFERMCVPHGPNQTALAFGAATGLVAVGLSVSSLVLLVDSLFRRGHWLDVLERGDLRVDVRVAPDATADPSAASLELGLGISGRLP